MDDFFEIAPRMVASFDEAEPGSLIVSLFLREPSICAWFIGPISIHRTGIRFAYVPPSACMNACFALLRAQIVARTLRVSLSIVDPEDLWPLLWDSSGF